MRTPGQPIFSKKEVVIYGALAILTVGALLVIPLVLWLWRTDRRPVAIGVAIVALAAALTLGALTDTSKKESAANPATPYVIHLRATSEGTNKVRVRGQSNLPDGAVISVSASRAFQFQHEHDVRAVHAAGKNATVSDGRFSTLLTLDEGDLLVDLAFQTNDPQIGPVAVVDNAVTVCAEFQTGKSSFDEEPFQPDEAVRDAVGPFGEKLVNSPQAKEFGSLTKTPSHRLEVVRRVAMEPPLLDEIADVQRKQPRPAPLDGFCLS